MVDFVRMAATAKRLIDKNGREITLTRPLGTPADPDQPWNGPTQGEKVLSLRGVFVPPQGGTQFGLNALGEATEVRDMLRFSQQIIIVAQGENDIRDYISVVDRDERWGVVATQVLRPADVTLLGFIGVRR